MVLSTCAVLESVELNLIVSYLTHAVDPILKSDIAP